MGKDLNRSNLTSSANKINHRINERKFSFVRAKANPSWTLIIIKVTHLMMRCSILLTLRKLAFIETVSLKKDLKHLTAQGKSTEASTGFVIPHPNIWQMRMTQL